MNSLEQNKLGFEGDTFARDKFKSIIEANGIKTVIETGTYLGNTTKHFSKWVDKVYTIEVNKTNFDKAKTNLTADVNVTMIYGNSAIELDRLLAKLYPTKEAGVFKGVKYAPVFFFLDAHWEAYNPLLDELKVISKYHIEPFIAIHDFKVPGNSEMGFDSYAGQDYAFEWIKPKVEMIYGADGYIVEYNSQATGAKRGIVYLSKK